MLGLVEPSGCRLSREELTNYMSLLCRSKLNWIILSLVSDVSIIFISLIEYYFWFD